MIIEIPFTVNEIMDALANTYEERLLRNDIQTNVEYDIQIDDFDGIVVVKLTTVK